MGIVPLSQLIRLPDVARGKLQLRAGEIVTVSVIKELSSSVWAVGVRGVVFRARTELPLSAGTTLPARVVKEGAHIELKLLQDAPSPLAAALGKAGFAQDPATLAVVAALVRSGVKIEERAVLILRQVLEKLPGDPKRNARLLGLSVAKGIKPDARELPALAALLDYGAGGEGRRRPNEKRKKRDFNPPAEAHVVGQLKKSVAAAPPGRAGPLALLNHLLPAAGAQNWIVAPFSVGRPEALFRGTLRFLYDDPSRRIAKTVVVAFSPAGERLQFSLLPEGGGHRLSVFSDQPRLIGAPLSRWAGQVAKLGKLGVHCDDLIHDDAGHDGFESEENGGAYRGIDVEG